MSTKRKRRSAADVTIRLGDLFDEFPDDLERAIGETLQHWRGWQKLWDTVKHNKGNLKESDIERLFALANVIHTQIYAALLNEQLVISRKPKGQKGPRLPAGVTFENLLPHLVKAKRVFESKDVRFEDWLIAHEWPGKMKPKNTTVRTWLTRYSKQISAYETQLAKLAEMEFSQTLAST